MAAREADSPGTVVRRIVGAIPAGRATSYGIVGRVATASGRPIGGARTVAWILASLKSGDQTPWHRVVGAGGVILLPDRRGNLQAARLRREGVRFSGGVIEPGRMIDESALLARLLRRRVAR